ncbi:hypothetical protein PtA15_7A123 [Puccinia triticina]|uniref:DUF1776-domain-containing protein n=1 Tax=Puccinia triticina TaxID=208348 RepID=A0ABY7CUK5_9BASI|nr:uncharacterized protein PtA15_7A123 [Puccinia triticina]WAQ86397.1 hypothetical protein PtA15_7A123 [Puccinia triticina]
MASSSVWELLDGLEAQLLHTLRQHSQTILSTTNALLTPQPEPTTPLATITTTSNTNNTNKAAILILIPAIYLTLHTTHYQRFLNTHPRIASYLPPSLRRTPPRRKHELLIILGADPGTLAEQLALHLALQATPLIATVSSPEMVPSLEAAAMGWLKPLVLDPRAPQASLKPFRRALAASLALRFPLAHAPSTFAHHPAQKHALVGLINCLPLPNSNTTPIRPLEALPSLDPHFQAVVGLSLDILKTLLPIIRNSLEKLGAQDAFILTLFPAKNSTLALPYLASSLIANQALETLMVTLRREIAISDSASRGKIRIVNERIGTFRTSSGGPAAREAGPPSLPGHLHPLYARSMARRIGLGPSPPLCGTQLAVGAESWTYLLLHRLVPAVCVDRWLVLVETLHHWVRGWLFCNEHPSLTIDRLVEKPLPSSSSPVPPALQDDSHPETPQPTDNRSADLAPTDSQQLALETGSVVHHAGPAELPPADPSTPESGSLAHSFVGSELDWNQP